MNQIKELQQYLVKDSIVIPIMDELCCMLYEKKITDLCEGGARFSCTEQSWFLVLV